MLVHFSLICLYIQFLQIHFYSLFNKPNLICFCTNAFLNTFCLTVRWFMIIDLMISLWSTTWIYILKVFGDARLIHINGDWIWSSFNFFHFLFTTFYSLPVAICFLYYCDLLFSNQPSCHPYFFVLFPSVLLLCSSSFKVERLNFCSGKGKHGKGSGAL